MTQRAVLLVNLGTPDSPSVADVRRYLREFLLDPRVIDYPAPLRHLVVRAFILPTRPRRSAEAYRSIWQPGGSPLMIFSRDLQAALQEQVPVHVELAMRYGQPSLPSAVARLHAAGVREVFLVPLYPHYAMSSYETVVVAWQEAVRAAGVRFRTTLLPPFYDDPAYIDALYQSARPWLDQPFDHLLVSFHGIPRRHLLKGDPSRAHCQIADDCCASCHPVHAVCYRHQTQRTARLLAERAGLPADRWSVSYQSRLGREVWLEPYTDATLERLGRAGTGRLLVITPAFVADCLETLEEIRVEGAEAFRHAGGREFEHIPCLNTHPAWVAWLAGRIHGWLDTAPAPAEAGAGRG